MSYQVLARKWRPRQFSELVGQQHVKTALANALNSSRLHHAYLFTGTRGVGKTTIARIFAKSLNCETGITATPCGQCSACLEIDAGNFVDLMEIDAASRTKVEDTRDLLDNVQYAPSRGRFKVYLIDEVHMLSRHSFNALLKTLEEPPPHVKFLLATTDPQKLPVTVLSRCLQFSLKALTVSQIEQHLHNVLAAEQIAFEPAALGLLAKAAKGSLRDSLSLTDQAIALTNSQVSLEPVRQMLGLLDTRWSVQLLTALLAADITLLKQALEALLSQQSDYQQVLDDMLALLHLAAMTQLQPAAAELSEQATFIQQLAAEQTPESIQLYYQLLLSGKKDLPFAPEPVIGLEMALLRAMAFVPAAQAPHNASSTDVPRHSSALSAAAINKPSPEPRLIAPTEPAAVTPVAIAPVDSAVSEAPLAEAESITEVPEVEVVAAPMHSASPQVLQPQATAELPSGIDPVTARIMQRRGVALPSALTPAASVEVEQAEKKFERPQAPTAVVSQDVPQEDEAADDSVSLAEQQALTEAWWQQQSFIALPAADADELDEQRFSIRFAAQVDPWSRLIEQLPVGGLMRLFLLHSAMQQQQDKVLLQVLQTQQHLDKHDFRQKLQQALSPVFVTGFSLDITYVSELNDSPIAIQQRIEQERKEYVSRLLQQDPKVLAIQQRFAAQLQLDTLQVN
ncbi:DNA polymerase III subunit gamma/tau [Alishewanella sp. d11]|uniref:DNA polymerase III subunit gamma/tau n=1 Tax=Alishewanella sp. d11 TaxID=3414030 RepID=UPI003BF88C82